MADNTTVIVVVLKWHTEGVQTVTSQKLRVDVDRLFDETKKLQDETIVESITGFSSL
jgi:hypothetical protein